MAMRGGGRLTGCLALSRVARFDIAGVGSRSTGRLVGPGLEIAERIRRRVRETWISPSPEPLSISIGSATFPADGRTKEGLLDKAEWAMHAAKRLGRNRVVAFPPAPPGDLDPPA